MWVDLLDATTTQAKDDGLDEECQWLIETDIINDNMVGRLMGK
jgi:hypothetical protein